MDQNFAAVVGAFSNIDTTNIGAAGISAGKVVPGTFSPGRYVFGGLGTTDVPITLQSLGSQTGNFLQVLSPTGTLRSWIDAPQGGYSTSGNLSLYPNPPTQGSPQAVITTAVGALPVPLPAAAVLGIRGNNPVGPSNPTQLLGVDTAGNVSFAGMLFAAPVGETSAAIPSSVAAVSSPPTWFGQPVNIINPNFHIVIGGIITAPIGAGPYSTFVVTLPTGMGFPNSLFMVQLTLNQDILSAAPTSGTLSASPLGPNGFQIWLAGFAVGSQPGIAFMAYGY